MSTYLPPTHVEGIVWHANLKESRYFVGTQIPVIEQGVSFSSASRATNGKKPSSSLKYGARRLPPKTESLAPLLRDLKLEHQLACRQERRQPPFSDRAGAPRTLPGRVLSQARGRLRKRGRDFFRPRKPASLRSTKTYLRDVKPVIQRRLSETGGDADTVHLELKGMPGYLTACWRTS